VEGSCEHGNEPPGSKKMLKFMSGCVTGGFSRRAQLHEVSWYETFELILYRYQHVLVTSSTTPVPSHYEIIEMV
jgi:hypothetical protein